MMRGEVSNQERAVRAAQAGRGGHWQVADAICWVKRTGSPWRDLPERHGLRRTAAA
jgi:transposase